MIPDKLNAKQTGDTCANFVAYVDKKPAGSPKASNTHKIHQNCKSRRVHYGPRSPKTTPKGSPKASRTPPKKRPEWGLQGPP